MLNVSFVIVLIRGLESKKKKIGVGVAQISSTKSYKAFIDSFSSSTKA
jgi:hypothetical protein